ncbi:MULTISPECIES: cell division protein ZapE [unclassified Mesorhizobium]|uniref:cell division protein ZapE n=1 Tax=unclassified Mesorhizobium TaxID=325217 RepID=UPI000F75204A|nr:MULTISPECIES: cell division protein ZapE [unclassified Mesorhizobium]AZO04110.1 cell division protein ZapE [Mesorhizobium sp. M2A.F.Ca.ET.043.02.1.1]RUW33118.1 cell division protein ZapE [Mesorhizobium sp. M2A.F.Ca.ET.015.02.1.1]RUW78831.1 cell division protein ZapE [Mesorhizobium sp. M2A.F.Ca.ET.067.02.1.1]RVC93804.1 cell division protein ZapE [Mesorhizobium sp. M2A.F.Ca.ET.017.03.2.1]RVC98544.1 cell division protein ZapE [Mesorhizobium sp. M2A.F.Ca.ET.029.05.1.1]
MHLRDGLQTHATVRQRYDHLVQSGAVERDPAQEHIVAALDRLIDEISAKRLAQKSSALGWLFAAKRQPREPVKGLYIHGSVGRGKTMLMDMFFELLPVRRKRRVHFNDFMADVQDRIQKHRQARKEGTVKEDDPIPPVARALADEAWVLCFDEFSVTDIADAMILSRLFSALFANGVVLVATSNVAPENLYRDGLNRQLFLPFISLIERNAHVMTLDADKDYRQEKLNRQPVYVTPDDAAAERALDEAWQAMTHGQPTGEATLTLKGRQLVVPRAAGDAARFSFADLCEKPLGARDYLAIAGRFSTVFIDHVPVLGEGKRNEAKRFILLIDTLYDHHMRLVMSAAAPPEGLYTAKRGTEVFEFERTASRLVEMQSRDWLEGWAERREAAPVAKARQAQV